MILISKKKAIDELPVLEEASKINNGYISKSPRATKHILNHFYSTVDNSEFYDLAEAILTEIEDPKDIVRAAEAASKRQPGGAFYRAKLWAKISYLLESNKKEANSEFRALCQLVDLHPNQAKDYINQGKAIEIVENSGITTNHLREAPLTLFQYAQRQKEKAGEYLIEAAKILEQDSSLSPTKIHQKWCQKNGGIKANLDIIKPSDWWAFGHPKWRKDEDFPGSIPGEIYANALYYFSPKTGIAVDAMAGSGMFKRVYDDRERWQKDSNFDLSIYLFDLNPCRDFIQKHDARKPLPIKADWIFIDPPYFGQSNHLFSGDLATARDYTEYLELLKEVILALTDSLLPNGKLCIFLPKWSGLKPEDPNYDVPADAYSIAINGGLHWIDAAFVSRARQQEPGSAMKNNVAKRDRRMRSDTCVLNIFEKLGV